MVSPPPISRVTKPDLPTTGAAIAHGGERNGDSGARQPPATMSVTPLPSGIVQPESSDLIWPGHPDARARGLFPLDDGEERLDMEERWQILRPFDIPKVLRPTPHTPINIRRMNKSDLLVEGMQINEYLVDVPPVGR